MSVLAAVLARSCVTSLYRYKETVSGITLARIDSNNIPNGTYIGERDVAFIYAKVSVTVENALFY